MLLISASAVVSPVPASALDRVETWPVPAQGEQSDSQAAAEASPEWLGTTIPVEITTPGQRASFAFEGSADEVVTIVLDGSTIRGCWTKISILTPQMTELASTQTCRATGDIKHVRLPADGTYTLMLTPAGASTGSARLTLYTVLDDVGVIQTDGSPVAVEVTAPGQLSSYTFDATAGQVVTAMLSGSTIRGCWTAMTILKPDQTRLDSVNTCRDNALLAHKTLPVDGTYTLTLNPAGVSTGRATLTLYTVVDVEGTIPGPSGPPARAPRAPRTPH